MAEKVAHCDNVRAPRKQPRRERMAEIVEADPLDSRPPARRPKGLPDLDVALARAGIREHILGPGVQDTLAAEKPEENVVHVHLARL